MKETMEPVIIEGRKLALNWWGKAWNTNLESYADYSNRIARGRSYVRDGAVIDLKISPGKVLAKVQGSRARPYTVDIDIMELSDARKADIVQRCAGKIEDLDSLISGRISKTVENIFLERDGLFPSPSEIIFHCSCPDKAYMCKHVAAVLYGIGVRFDNDPLLFFSLRGLDVSTLIRRSVDDRLSKMLSNADVRSDRVISDDRIKGLFGSL